MNVSVESPGLTKDNKMCFVSISGHKKFFLRLKLKKSLKNAISKCPVVLGNFKKSAKITKNHENFFSLKLYLYVVCVYR